jgi:hypothetical protein
MTDTYPIEERLRRFVAAADDSDWQDVLRRTGADHSSMLPLVTRVPSLVPPWPRQLTQRRRLVGVSAAAAVVVTGVVVGLLVTAASPPSASAAAQKALATTAAAPSGTMTLSTVTSSSIGEGMSTVATVRWNGKDVAIASGTDANVLPGFNQIVIIGGAVYLQRPDGSWLHYANEADLERSRYSGTVLTAYSLAVASRAAEVIASAYGLQKTEQSDGSTVYSGLVPPNSPGKAAPSKGPAPIVVGIAQNLLPTFGSGGAVQLVVGSDGLVKQMSETAAPPITGGWKIEYSGLDDSPAIAPPTNYTEGTAADLPK